MKTFKNFRESLLPVNEAKYKGKDILPNWLTKDDFGSLVKNIRDLKEGEKYIIWEGGMDTWNGEYEYSFDKIAKEYLFDDVSTPGAADPYSQMTFTKDEMEDYIKNKLILKQN